jgi:hypothetical protein
VERAGVLRVGGADEPIEPFGLIEPTGTMMRERGRKLVHDRLALDATALAACYHGTR